MADKKERIKLILIISQNFQINFMQINIHKSCFTAKFEYIHLIYCILIFCFLMKMLKILDIESFLHRAVSVAHHFLESGKVLNKWKFYIKY